MQSCCIWRGEKWQSACWEVEKSVCVAIARLFHSQITERKIIKSVLGPSFHAVKCENEKTSIGRVLYHITIALIRALVDWAISKEAHVLVSKRAHFFRASPISV